MSTRRLFSRLSYRFLLVAACGAGCSSTRAMRPEVASSSVEGIKTIASIGDQPLPVSSGEPGFSVSDDDPLVISAAPKTQRISGRVVDDQGSPLEGVLVRVAEGSVQGGRVKEATTDRAGGFTIRGLRAGEDYTLLAETDIGERRLNGRVEATAAESGVRIDMREIRSVRSGKTIQRASKPTPTEVDEMSELEDFADDVESVSNDEDLPEPSKARVARKDPVDREDSGPDPETVSAWKKGASKLLKEKDEEADSASSVPAEEVLEPVGEVDDTTKPAAPAAEDRPADETALIDKAYKMSSAAPPASVVSVIEERLVASKPLETPVESTPAPSTTEPRPVPEPNVAVAEEPAETPAVKTPEPLILANFPSEDSTIETERQRPTWGALPKPHTRPKPVPKVAATPPPQVAEVPSPKVVTGLPIVEAERVATEPTRRRFMRFSKGQSNRKTIAARNSAPKIDSKNQKILDFTLPDLAGKPFQLNEIDSDLILIDFWGTWCAPCAESVPKLAELQQRFGPKSLQVIGIACEKGSIDGRAERVAEASRKLGANYTVLLDDAEVPSRLQEQLYVQVYPTMVLIDRQGTILWRDSGATPLNLARLERVIESHAGRTSIAAARQPSANAGTVVR